MLKLLLSLFVFYSFIFADCHMITDDGVWQPGTCYDNPFVSGGKSYTADVSRVSHRRGYGVDGDVNYCTQHFYTYNSMNSDGSPNGLECEEMVLNNKTGNNYYHFNVTSSCQPLSDVTVSLTKTQCVGSSSVYSNNMATQGTLQYQDCDNTCYVLEPHHIPCSTVIPHLQNLCDTDTNNLHLTCNDTNSYYTSYDYQCTPDNNNTNPCQDAYNQLSSTCINGTIQGSCQDNGMVITSNTLNCVPPDPDTGNPCDDAYSAMLTQCNVNNQSVMGSCQSRDGQIISNTLQCSPLPPDHNNTNGNIDLTETNNILRDIRSEITVSNNNLNDITNNTNNINNKISNTNNKLSKVNNNLDLINNKLTSTNNNLRDIRSEITVSNNNLNDITNNTNNINNKISNTNNKLSKVNNNLDLINNKLTTTNNNLNDIKNINKSSRDTLKDIKNGVVGLGDKIDDVKNSLDPETQSDTNNLGTAFSDITSFLNDTQSSLTNMKGVSSAQVLPCQ